MSIPPIAPRLASLLATSLVLGCAVGPDYHEPQIAVPRSYAETLEGATPDVGNGRWWESFGDRSLVKLIEAALRDNPDLSAAAARIAESRAIRDSISGGDRPNIDASGHAGRDSISRNGEALANLPFSNARNTFTTYRAGFDASWEIDLFGHTRRSLEAANARLDSSIEARHEAIVSVAGEVARNYVDYRTYQRRIDTTRRSVQTFEQTVDLVRLQTEAGLASVLDLDRAQIDWLSNRANLHTLEAEGRASAYALATLVGSEPAAIVAMLSSDAPIPADPGIVPIGLPSDLARRRPDVRRSERELAAATADIGVAVADQFPRFSLTAALGSDSVTPGNFAVSASRYWSVVPQVTAPLLDGGRRRNVTKARLAARDEALARYRKAVLAALADVESALIRVDRQRARVADLDAAYRVSVAALGLSRERYQAGDTPLTDLLDTERQAHLVGDQRVQASGQLATNIISLYKALGGGWEFGVGKPRADDRRSPDTLSQVVIPVSGSRGSSAH